MKAFIHELHADDIEITYLLRKGTPAETASYQDLNRKLTDLESALAQALDAVQTLGPMA